MGIFNKFIQKIKGGNNQTGKKLNILRTNIPNKNSSDNDINFSFKNIKNSVLENYRTSKMLNAYTNSNNKKINKLLSKGKFFYKSIKFPENNNFSLLHQSISDNNIETINLILEQKYIEDNDIINDKDNDLGLAPVHLTCIYNEPEILGILLDTEKTSVEEKTEIDGLMPLHVCASSGSLKTLVFLVENYYDENIEENQEDNEVNKEKNAENLDQKISNDKENNENISNDDKNNDFIKLSKSKYKKFGSNMSIMDKINKVNKEKELNPLDVFNDEKWTPLHYACFQSKLDTVNYLLEKGCDLYLQNEQKLSPLALCVLQDNFELFEILYNFNFKQKNPSENNYENSREISEQAKLIHIASISKKGTRILDYLLKDPNNANMICSEELQATPLHFACMKDNIKAVKSLLRYNASVNVSDYLGNTPLFYATENGNLEILKLLHENGADGIKKNFNGINCFQIAMNQDNREVRLFYLSQNQYRYLEDKDRLF